MQSTIDEVARTLIESHITECRETRQENKNAFAEVRNLLETRRIAASAQVKRIHDRLDHFTWWLITLLITMIGGVAMLAWYFGRILAPLGS